MKSGGFFWRPRNTWYQQEVRFVFADWSRDFLIGDRSEVTWLLSPWMNEKLRFGWKVDSVHLDVLLSDVTEHAPRFAIFCERSLAETRSTCQNNCSATGNGFQIRQTEVSVSTRNVFDSQSVRLSIRKRSVSLRVLVNCHETDRRLCVCVCVCPDTHSHTHTHFKPGNVDNHAQQQL